MADTDTNPTQGTKRMGQGIDWRGALQWVAATSICALLTVGAWLHGAVIGHGDRLTTIEAKEVSREKQQEKDAAAATKSMDEMKTATADALKEIKGEVKDMAKTMEQVRLELARDRRPSSAGGMP